MQRYASVCGWTLARGHARSADRIAIGRFPRSTVRMGETSQIAVATEKIPFFDHDTR
jgi:hypothetical protein